MSRTCLALLAVVVACGPQAADAPLADPSPATTPPPPGPTPAFIVIGADDTMVVPVEALRPVERRAGIWVQWPDRQGVRVGALFRSKFTTASDPDLTLPACDSPDADNACAVQDATELFGYVHADGPQRVRWSASPGDYGGCDCLLVSEEQPGTIDRCDPELAPKTPTAVVGGTLFRTAVWSNEGCSDVRVLDAVSDAVAVLPGVRPVAPPDLNEPPSCRSTDAIEIDWAPVRDSTCQLGDSACAKFCFHDTEAEAVAVRRGELVHVTGSASSEGGTCSCSRGQTLTTDGCPSAVEPCGDPAAFEGLAAREAFWVATDGAHALAGEAGELHVINADGVVRSVDAPARLLGVHYVDDARALLDLAWQTPTTIGVAPRRP